MWDIQNEFYLLIWWLLPSDDGDTGWSGPVDVRDTGWLLPVDVMDTRWLLLDERDAEWLYAADVWIENYSYLLVMEMQDDSDLLMTVTCKCGIYRMRLTCWYGGYRMTLTRVLNMCNIFDMYAASHMIHMCTRWKHLTHCKGVILSGYMTACSCDSMVC